MNFWLCISGNYQTVSVALCQEHRAIDMLSVDKTDSNRLLTLSIKQLLDTHHLKFADIAFIGVNTGPGPYTSLRIGITVANGLAYATDIKLVAIDALQALLEEHKDNGCNTTVALLNAFNQEVFYGIITKGGIFAAGYASVDRIGNVIQEHANGPYYLVGNGVELYKEQLMQQLSEVVIPSNISAYATLPAMIKQGYQSWQEQKVHDELFPGYLKDVHYTNSIKVK